jgi:hypothetical protein
MSAKQIRRKQAAVDGAAESATGAQSLMNREIHVGLLRCAAGELLLLYLTDQNTGEIKAMVWEQAPPQLKAAARVWAVDPLGLIERYATASAEGARVARSRDAA